MAGATRQGKRNNWRPSLTSGPLGSKGFSLIFLWDRGQDFRCEWCWHWPGAPLPATWLCPKQPGALSPCAQPRVRVQACWAVCVCPSGVVSSLHPLVLCFPHEPGPWPGHEASRHLQTWAGKPAVSPGICLVGRPRSQEQRWGRAVGVEICHVQAWPPGHVVGTAWLGWTPAWLRPLAFSDPPVPPK